MKKIMQGLMLLVMTGLLLGGCGRKEAPKMLAEGSPPQISNLKYEINGGTLKFDFVLLGSAEGVGYQIDRTEMDPYCKCPGFFRRYFEQPAFPGQVGVRTTKLISLKSSKKEYIFRLRAVDAEGNLGVWSELIHARGVDLFK